MKGLETGKEKIQKICEAIRKETLDPAKQEGREIVENAHLKAQEIVKEAEKRAAALKEAAEREIEEKKRVCNASLQLACRQVVEELKQKIEKELFSKELASLIGKEMKGVAVIRQVIEGIVEGLSQRGGDEELAAVIPKGISPKSISEGLSAAVLEKLDGGISLGEFEGGAQVKIKGKQITLDLSDEMVRQMVGEYIRRDLRHLIFA